MLVFFYSLPRSSAHCPSLRISAEMVKILPPQYKYIHPFLCATTKGAFLADSGSRDQAIQI
jgi:hypothetical protein